MTMHTMKPNTLFRLIHWWEAEILRHPWWVLLATLTASAFTLHYVMNHLTVNTDTAAMISTDVPFQKNRLRLEKAFPQDVSSIVLLVEGKTPEQTNLAVESITQSLESFKEHLISVHVPDGGDFFRHNGLLYLTVPEVEKITGDLASAQPFIGRLAKDNSLRGLLDLLGEALQPVHQDAMDIQPLLSSLRKVFETEPGHQSVRLSWQQMMMNQESGKLGITKRFILIHPKLYYEEIAPAEKALKSVDEALSSALRTAGSGVTVYKTGEVVMEYEEMQTASQSVGNAGIASMILVCMTLWFAYRSFRLMFATFATLSLGLVFSLGFATVAIGQLNLISISFAVLFIGMGDAYSSHFCLRYRELRLRGETQSDALRDTLTSTGTSLMLCTLTAAIGLYAFIPTNYTGVAELGIIAGTSMFIALATTFTVLPAIMNLLPYHAPGKKPSVYSIKKRTLVAALISNWPLKWASGIRMMTVILVLASLPLMTELVVDFNPTNLRDPNTESVKTFKYLLSSKDTSPMTISSLATSEKEVRERTAAFERLNTVDRVISVLDLVPSQQTEKLEMLGDINLIMAGQLKNFPLPDQSGATLSALKGFLSDIHKSLVVREDAKLEELAISLARYVNKLEKMNEADQKAALLQLQDVLIGNLPATIRRLDDALNAYEITMDSLPEDLRSRWLSPDGQYRIQVSPSRDLNDLESLRSFIKSTQTVDANVTDVPVTYLESMDEVVKAFIQAFSIALGTITLLLFVVFRKIRDTALVLLPLVLASLFTAALTVLLKVPFNFANIIALPLMFGLGVDNGIHMMHRLRHLETTEGKLLEGSESQGVFFGALTTVFSFVSLAFTPHPGMSSLGTLLALGLVLSLVCALVVLPAFSAWRNSTLSQRI